MDWKVLKLPIPKFGEIVIGPSFMLEAALFSTKMVSVTLLTESNWIILIDFQCLFHMHLVFCLRESFSEVFLSFLFITPHNLSSVWRINTQLEADYEIIGAFFWKYIVVLQIGKNSLILNWKKKVSGRDSRTREVQGCEATWFLFFCPLPTSFEAR